MILHSARAGHTVFINTHNLVEAQRLCDRVGVMEHGRLVAVGTPHDLARRLMRALDVEIEVAPEDLPAAERTLTAHPGLSCAAQRQGVLLVSGAERAAIPDLLVALVNAGIHIYQVTPQEPTLEDVYFALHSNREVNP